MLIRRQPHHRRRRLRDYHRRQRMPIKVLRSSLNTLLVLVRNRTV